MHFQENSCLVHKKRGQFTCSFMLHPMRKLHACSQGYQLLIEFLLKFIASIIQRICLIKALKKLSSWNKILVHIFLCIEISVMLICLPVIALFTKLYVKLGINIVGCANKVPQLQMKRIISL